VGSILFTSRLPALETISLKVNWGAPLIDAGRSATDTSDTYQIRCKRDPLSGACSSACQIQMLHFCNFPLNFAVFQTINHPPIKKKVDVRR
jgi:hypothetical protein